MLLWCYQQTPLDTQSAYGEQAHSIGHANGKPANINGNYPRSTGSNPPAEIPDTTQQSSGSSSTTQLYQNPTVEPLSDAKEANFLFGSSTAQKQGIYTVSTAAPRLSVYPSVVQLPLAIDKPNKPTDDTCVVCNLGGGTATLTVHVESERVGVWPAIPQPIELVVFDKANNLRGRLLSKWFSPMPPTADVLIAQKVYRVEAQYIYALNRIPSNNDPIYIGAMPWMDYDPQKDTQMSLKDLFSDPAQKIGRDTILEPKNTNLTSNTGVPTGSGTGAGA